MPMVVDRTIKKGTLLPPLQVRLGFSDPAEDLSGFVGLATPVTFSMKSRGSSAVPVINDKAARVAAVGLGWVDVEYEWQAGDTDVTGLFFGEFIFDVGGKPLPAPTSNWIAIRIINAL